MAEVVDARAVFAPQEEGEFTSGELVTPGVYVDVEGRSVLTVLEADTLPDEVRVVRSPRRYLRFESLQEAREFLSSHRRVA